MRCSSEARTKAFNIGSGSFAAAYGEAAAFVVEMEGTVENDSLPGLDAVQENAYSFEFFAE
jgi:hypothetical protein